MPGRPDPPYFSRSFPPRKAKIRGRGVSHMRDCMARATTYLAFQVCQQQLTDDQRRALDKAAHGP